ncbi:MAG: efflux RND transporter permease subunit, partial [Proteobacteria bacterium]|nr:efflux RND transporter permease subunit [Pseudomonadota bacterium]
MIKRFAQHRVAANLTMIMMTLIGLWALRSMPSQLDPPLALPLVFIDVEWRGASAEDVEALVTTPIEAQLRNLDNLHELESRSTTGYMGMRVQFQFDTDMTLAMDQVKQYVANVRNLPVDIEPPIIRRFIDYEPVAEILLTGTGSLT